MKFRAIIILISLAVALSACARKDKAAQPDGGVLGVNSSSKALIFLSDMKFGSRLSDIDKEKLALAEAKALDYGKSGEQISWKGKGENTSGKVIAFQPFRVGKTNCRRFQHTLALGQNFQSAQATACRRGTGDWKLVR